MQKSNNIAWFLNFFPSKPLAYLKMGFPRTRSLLGGMPANALTLGNHKTRKILPLEVRIKVNTVSLNFRDYAIALGLYAPNQTLPLVPCSDACGEIIEIGSDVKKWKVGDRVITHYIQDWIDGPGKDLIKRNTLGSPLEGVLQTSIICPEHGIILAPDSLTNEESSTLPISGLTAWSALTTHAKAKKGETLLIQGSGGVSLFGIQIGRALGLNVIVITGSKNKEKKLKELGANKVIIANHTEDWSKDVILETKSGVDIVLDVGGGATIYTSSKSLKHSGRIICIGFLGGINPKFNLSELILKNVFIKGITVGNRNELSELANFIDNHKINPVIDSVYEFNEANLAFEKIASGKQFGNICINVCTNSNKLEQKI